MGRLIDETGNRYGKLTVIKRASNKGTKACWVCQCDCGNTVIVAGQDLRYKKKHTHTQSCGCVKNQNLTKYNETIFRDLTGQTFGYLVVLEKAPFYSKNKTTMWKCQCQCGKIINVQRNNLLSGNTTSCGCKAFSKGEEKITNLLKDNNIDFQTQKTFDNCRFLDTNMLARFDFYLPQFNTILEYDGEQHFRIGRGYYDNINKFKKIQEHDNYKNQWCKENNISIIRIPYIHYDDITLSDLLPETSQFLIK